MGNIQQTRLAQIPHEGRRPASHIGANDGGRVVKRYRPPCTAMLRNIAIGSAMLFGPLNEPLRRLAKLGIQFVKVDRKTKDAAEPAGI